MSEELKCAYQEADGPCGEPIETDLTSYSGYSHTYQKTPQGEKVDWLHWASPQQYGPQSENMSKVFKLCAVCGKTGPDNEDHIKFAGHKFLAV